MRKTLRLLPLVIILQAGFSVPAFSQSNQPIGSANTLGSVSNFNANSANNPSAPGGTSPSSPSLSPGTFRLLPNGTRASPTISTITVCDDFAGSFQNEIDICRLK